MPDPPDLEDQSVKTEQALVAQIEWAFADVPYPGDDRICEGVNAETVGSEEGNIAALFRGRHWRDVPLEDLARYSATLSFLTPEAYRFYMPAYLLAMVRLTPEKIELWCDKGPGVRQPASLTDQATG